MNPESYNLIRQRKSVIYDQLKNCRLCPHLCGVNRLKGETGTCGLDEKLYCFREMINDTEEPGLVPSHQVYFSGCNLRCGFCSVAEWNEKPTMVPMINAKELPQRIEERKKQGAVNLNLLGGEPAISLYGILELLENIPWETSVVWNSNMYFSDPVRDALDGLIDVYLADYKCSNQACCRKVLGASNYEEIVQSNLIWALNHTSLLIRHVILPGHLECCSRPILEWIAEHVPNARISLRDDYIPPFPAGNCPEGYLNAGESQKVLEIAKRLDLKVV